MTKKEDVAELLQDVLKYKLLAAQWKERAIFLEMRLEEMEATLPVAPLLPQFRKQSAQA